MNSATTRVVQLSPTGAAANASARGPSTDACLHAVVQASGCLLAASALASGTQAAVQALQTHTGLDRVYVFADATGQQGVVLFAEALADGVLSIRTLFGDRVYRDAEFNTVIPPLRAGHIYQSVHPQREGYNANLNAALATRSDLMFPVFVDSRFWGIVGFDDCHDDRAWDAAEVLALQGAATALAAAVQRDAAEAAREKERQRYAALLDAVARISRELLQTGHWLAALPAAFQRLGEAAGIQRVVLLREVGVPPSGAEHRVVVEWCAAGVATHEALGLTAIPNDAAPAFCAKLHAGHSVWSRAGELQDSVRGAFRRLSIVSTGCVPVIVAGEYWGAITFDDCVRARAWHDAEIDSLSAAANAVAAAVARQQAEDARLNEEQRRTEESQRLNRLLAAVAQSLQFLLGDAGGDFQGAVQATLRALGQACGIHRVKVILQRTDPASGELAHFLEHEWWAPGLVSQTTLGLTQFPNALIPEWLALLQAGRGLWYLIDDVPAAVRTAFAQVGVQSVCAVPIFGGAEYLGTVTFDDCVNKRRWSAAEIDALTAAARTLGAAIHRHALQLAMMAERDLRIAAEQARADQAQQLAARIKRHSLLLSAVAASAEDLLACVDPADCLDAVLARVGEVTHAERVCLARLEWTPHDPALHGWQAMAHEWARPGVSRQSDGPLQRFAMERSNATWDLLLAQLASERRILATIENLDEPFRSEQLAVGIAWTLCYPVLLEGQVWGLLRMDCATPFDDYGEADLAALQTVSTTIADAMLRRTLEQRALATEQARVAEAQGLNQLLESVVQSSRELLDAPDFKTGLQQWLQVLAISVDADVALLGSLAPTAGDETLAEWQVHWSKHGIRSTPPVPATADFIEWHARLLRGEAVWAQRDELLDPASVRYWQQNDCWTNLLMPVVSAGGTLGFICFDWRERRAWQPAYGTVLRTAADSVAAAIQRHEAAQALLAERDRRIDTEQARAQESVRLASLLSTVVQSSRLLIDAQADSFEPALLRWLGTFGRETQAIRATLYDQAVFEPTGQATVRMLCEWVREGVKGSVAVSFEHPFVIDPRGAEDLIQQMTSGQVVTFHADEVSSPMKEFLVEQGNASVVAVPVFIDGRPWGHLSFDFAARFEPDPATLAMLQTAADTLAAMVKRNESARLALEERDRRLVVEHQALVAERARAHALRHANDELIGSMAQLVALHDLPGFLGQLLQALTRTCGAQVGAILVCDAGDGRMRMRQCVVHGQSVNVQQDARLTLWRHAVPDAAANDWRRNLQGQVLAYNEVGTHSEPGPWPEHLQWHAAMGHRLSLHFPLNIGGQLIGIAALMLQADNKLADFQLQQAVVLAQQAAIAMQLERLARLAETTAVQSERKRMTAEIHDSLAQSFTSIAMQSEALAGRWSDTARPAETADAVRVLRLIERTAREGLAEARNSVLGLLPTASDPQALGAALAELAARSSVSGGIQCRFSTGGQLVPIGSSVLEAFLRIAQEATSNAMRHSGGSLIALRLEYTQTELCLTIDDDGNGTSTAEGLKRNGGFGMAGMQARAEAVGAVLQVTVTDLGGYRVQVCLAYEQKRPMA